jgi:hypothetical protein
MLLFPRREFSNKKLVLSFNECKVLVDKPQGKGPLGRPTHRWEENIKTDLRNRDVKVWIGFKLMRAEASGRLL